LSEEVDNPGVIIFPPLLAVISTAVGLTAHFLSYDHWPISGWLRAFGGVLVLAGVAIVSWGRKVMRAAGTNVRPDLPSTTIVADGPFAFTRNPLYLSLLMMFAGTGIALASPAFLLIIIPFFLVLHFGVVLREERYLEAKFGDAYRAYKAHVRRWI
jgi:protein-S-isoprenylcysteine O-methyltransferase Ste14